MTKKAKQIDTLVHVLDLIRKQDVANITTIANNNEWVGKRILDCLDKYQQAVGSPFKHYSYIQQVQQKCINHIQSKIQTLQKVRNHDKFKELNLMSD